MTSKPDLPVEEETMNVITISREYGAGGRELARRLSEALGWEVLDRELIHQAALLEELPDSEFEGIDEKPLTMAEHFQRHPLHERYMHGLIEATRRAVAKGNVILVGRGTRQILGDVAGAFHLRLEASKEWRAQRTAEVEGLSFEQALARCAQEDRTRGRFMRYFFKAGTEEPTNYHLVVNTERVPLEDVVACVAMWVREAAPGNEEIVAAGRRVMTMTGELGAGDMGFAPTLAERLGLRVFDRELLEREANRLGVSLEQVNTVDERQAGLFERFSAGCLHQRYCEALRQVIGELAEAGDAILVGRGGCQILKDDPRAFHVRLVASYAVRLRRVMEHRWLAEAPARHLIDLTDAHRRRFYETLFGVDWTSPLGYHSTVNTGRLGPRAVDLVEAFATRSWRRTVATAGGRWRG